MTDMGRPKSEYPDLPPRMAARKLKSGGVLFYYQAGGKKIPLGGDRAVANTKWAELENSDTTSNFPAIVERYRLEALPKKSFRTQKEQGKQLDLLKIAFPGFGLESIQPKHVRQYLDKRSKKIAGNREIALFSHLWNWARQRGLTDRANPCAGVERNKENPRKIYVRIEAFEAVRSQAVFWLQDAMDLLLDAGQRPSDILKATKHDIYDGSVIFEQAKTGAKVRIRLQGQFKTTIERILARTRPVQTIYLIADELGQRVTIWKLEKEFRRAFEKAGELALTNGKEWQLRDLRKKSATDGESLKDAQERLGHANEMTTARIYRQVKGTDAKPLR